MTPPPDVTALLDEWSRGDHRALDQLLPLVYAELRRIARRELRRERAGHTLQPTALVHEAYLRLVDQRQVDWRNRAHFLVSPHRSCAGSWSTAPVGTTRTSGATVSQCVSIDQAAEAAAPDGISVLALDHALERLETVDRGLAHIVELRAFGGLTIEEAAHVLKVSASTAKREWRTAKAWLTRELGPEGRP